jgi:hypothetical protein
VKWRRVSEILETGSAVKVGGVEWIDLLLEKEDIYSRNEYNVKNDLLVKFLWVSRDMSQPLPLAYSDWKSSLTTSVLKLEQMFGTVGALHSWRRVFSFHYPSCCRSQRQGFFLGTS